MALAKCKECGGDVSTFADKCPHCGAPPLKSIPPPVKTIAKKSEGVSGFPTWAIIGLSILAFLAIVVLFNQTDTTKATNAPQIVGSADATSSSNPPDSFRGVKWDSTLPSIAKLRNTVMKGCAAIPAVTDFKATLPCSHTHIDTDDVEMFDQKQNAPQFLGVDVSEQILSWSYKKFWSGELYSPNESDYEKFRQQLITEYGPPTFENRSLQITKWMWAAQPRKVVIQLYLDNQHTVSLLFTQED